MSTLQQSESPTVSAPATNARPSASRIQSSHPASRLHRELDTIVGRPTTASGCREALLDCLARHRSLTGGGWFRVDGEQCCPESVRLDGPVFERDDIRRWLNSLAVRTCQSRTDVISRCPQIRNLAAVCVFAGSDLRPESAQMAPDDERPSVELVFISLTAVTEATSTDSELTAAQSLVRAWQNWTALTGTRRSAEQLRAISAVLELVGRINSAEGHRGACQTLVNELHQHLNTRFTALGLRSRRSVTARLSAVSHAGSFDPNSQQAGRLEAALNETIVRHEFTCFPPVDESSGHQHLAHKRLAETFGVEAVISVPLNDSDGNVMGAIVTGGDARSLLQPACRSALNACAGPVGTALTIAERAEGGRLRRFGRRAGFVIAGWRGLLTLGAIAATVGILLVPVPYQISCRCRTEPVIRRYGLAPYDGMLEDTFVQPGDTVARGDLLARMDSRELSLELAGLTAESERAQKQRDVHMAGLAVADALMSEMELERLRTRETLLRHRLNNMEIRSPVSGIVLDGSLERRQHYPVTIGEVLYEVAPMTPVRIEVAVASEERHHVAVGMLVEMRMDGAAGGESFRGQICRIQPRSDVRDSQNIFNVEVIVDNPDGTLKPGMEGSARITGRPHALGWNLGHRFWERLMTRVWW